MSDYRPCDKRSKMQSNLDKGIIPHPPEDRWIKVCLVVFLVITAIGAKLIDMGVISW